MESKLILKKKFLTTEQMYAIMSDRMAIDSAIDEQQIY